MKRIAVAMVFGLALVSAQALAQETKVIQQEDRVVVRKRSVVDFTDVTIDGELSKPEGSFVLNKKRTRFDSLIKVRQNFVPELQKSVDDL